MSGLPYIAHTHVPYATLELANRADINPAPVLANLDLILRSHPYGAASLIAQDDRLSLRNGPTATTDLLPPLLPKGHSHGMFPIVGHLHVPTIPSAPLLRHHREWGEQEGHSEYSPDSSPLQRHSISFLVIWGVADTHQRLQPCLHCILGTSSALPSPPCRARYQTVERVTSSGGGASLLAVPALIAWKAARLFEASSCPWTPRPTGYPRLSSKRVGGGEAKSTHASKGYACTEGRTVSPSPGSLGALAAPVIVVMVMVPMITAPMVAALPTDEQQANHQQPHPMFHGRCEECHRLLLFWFSRRYAPLTRPRVSCPLQRFPRAPRVTRPSRGSEERTVVWASPHEERCSERGVSPHGCAPRVGPHRWGGRDGCHPLESAVDAGRDTAARIQRRRVRLMAVLGTGRRLSIGRYSTHARATRGAR